MRSHWAFAILAALALALLLKNLGSDYLWADEGDTAVLASNILKFGVPKAWDGVTFIDSDKGARDNDDLVMVSHPWIQYYVAAASFFLFGENTFAARLPFALAGWLSILLVYLLVWRIATERWAAFCAAAMTMSSIQFLLYSRQCRNYSLSMLFTCWLLWHFFKMKSARHCALFAVAAILLFHAHPTGIVPVGVLGILALIYPPFAPQRRWFCYAISPIVIFTLPWLALARNGYVENTEPLRSLGDVFSRLSQYAIESASVTPLIGTIILLIIGLVTFRNRTEGGVSQKFVTGDEMALLIIIFMTLLCYGLTMMLTQSGNALWHLGLRYTPAMLPLIAMGAGILIARIARGRTAIWLPLLLVFCLTKLAQLSPWIAGKERVAVLNGDEFAAPHVPIKLIDCFLGRDQLMFLRDLWRENRGTIARTCEFLREHANQGDVLITNYGSEPLYFHTRLPQAMKIFPEYPIYEAARRKGLPDYVFGVDHARWVIWRFAWNGWQGHPWDEVGREIVARGGHLDAVAQVEETLWENRENIHFRRFSGGEYLFPWRDQIPPAIIFRIDWQQ